MAIEQGLTLLIQSGLAALTPPVNVPGGFAIELPENTLTSRSPMAWSYRWITSKSTYYLDGTQDGYTSAEIQIDCYGYQTSAASSQVLARAIKRVLQAAIGATSITLADADNTVVQAILRLPGYVAGFNDANRSFVQSLEYQIDYYEQP